MAKKHGFSGEITLPHGLRDLIDKEIFLTVSVTCNLETMAVVALAAVLPIPRQLHP
jgi:hypothetical protein